MSKPQEIMAAHKAQLDQADALAAARKQVVDAYFRLFAQIGGHVEEYATLCAKFGRDNIHAGYPADVSATIDASIERIKALWEAESRVAFPTIAAQPVQPVQE